MGIRVSLITSFYKGLRYLPHYFENVAAQSIFPQIEIVFVHNEPSEEELAIITPFKKRYSTQFQHIIVSPVESLGASWNRGWKAARGEFITMWNVDDRRVNDSIEKQTKLLDQSPNCDFVYGDFFRVAKYGSEKGEFIKTPPFSKRYFSRSFPHGGAFYMWRTGIHKQIGFFDEQLTALADFDFSLRAVLTNHNMCRVDTAIGYFTDEKTGISTRDGGYAVVIEQTVIQLRYGIFDKIHSQYLEEAREYNIHHIKNSGKMRHLSDIIPSYYKYLESRSILHRIGFARNMLRKIFIKIGILKFIHRFQKRYINKDI